MTTNAQNESIYIGESRQRRLAAPAFGELVTLYGEPCYKIGNLDALEPFFISLVSSSDHWLFIASTGGLTAGRASAEQALFPYYTVDRITENYENTGHKAILRVQREGKLSLWEPFSERQQGIYRGIGVAALIELTNPSAAFYGVGGARIASQDGATLRLEPTGVLTVSSSVGEQGQGAEAVFAQIAADAVGVSIDRVRVVTGATDTAPCARARPRRSRLASLPPRRWRRLLSSLWSASRGRWSGRSGACSSPRCCRRARTGRCR